MITDSSAGLAEVHDLAVLYGKGFSLRCAEPLAFVQAIFPKVLCRLASPQIYQDRSRSIFSENFATLSRWQ
jgi:hypothetical protein